MKILSVDSSAKVASVALCDGEKPVYHIFSNTALTHSQTLLVMIDQMIKNANWKRDDIELFAVSNGPGSFTGVRIGVSLIKGLAFGSGLPCVGVSTLKALAFNLAGVDGIICPVMDARNSQVYNAMFECGGGEIKRVTDDRALSMVELYNEIVKIDKRIYILGDGAELFYGFLKSKGFEKDITLANPSVRYQNAVSVAAAALDEYKDGGFTNDKDLFVKYLRPSQAEREYEKKLAEEK